MQSHPYFGAQIGIRGAQKQFAVVLLVWTEGDWECATRCDCAHGFAHRDVLGRRAGLLYEQSFAG